MGDPRARTAAAAASAALLLGGAGVALLATRRRRRESGVRARVVVLGLGYCGGAVARHFATQEQCEVIGTTREKVNPADTNAGVRTLVLGTGAATNGHRDASTKVALEELVASLQTADFVLVTAPPGEAGDPFLAEPALREALEKGAQNGALVVYLSSVGVYGDQEGHLVTEKTPPAARTKRAQRRLAAEEAWRQLALQERLAIVRLPGIYGPFRGPLAKAREENVRIQKDGHVFSRIHVDDVINLCSVLLARHRGRVGDLAATSRPPMAADDKICVGSCGGSCCENVREVLRSTDGVINCCDSEPAPQHEVAALAYELLGKPVPNAVPFDNAELSAMQRSFYEESRRMSNQRLLEIVGALRYPSYRTGLAASLATEAEARPREPLWAPLSRSVARGFAQAASLLAAGQSDILRVALIDNGSLKPEATLSLRRLAAKLEAQASAAGRPMRVEAVSARFADRIPARDLEGKPAETMPGWLKRMAALRRRPRVLLLPLLIGPSDTMTKSMPSAVRGAELEALAEVAPPLVCLCPVLMPQGASGAVEVAGMLVDGIAAADSAAEHVILCDHGSPVKRVAAAREAVRLEMERKLGRQVLGVCMERREGPEYDFNGPLLEDALSELPEQGRVVVALLFLQEGRHAGPGGDIETIIAGVMEKRPNLKVTTTKVLANHPGLVDLLLTRTQKGVPLRLLP